MTGVEEKIKNVPVINYHLGMIYLKLGEDKEAGRYLQMSVSGKQKFPGRKEAEKALMLLKKEG